MSSVSTESAAPTPLELESAGSLPTRGFHTLLAENSGRPLMAAGIWAAASAVWGVVVSGAGAAEKYVTGRADQQNQEQEG